MERRKFTQGFKLEAVNLIGECEATVTETSRDLSAPRDGAAEEDEGLFRILGFACILAG